ncbi:MAG: ABC transporter permease [SAR324 cluster bacterium]|nr:ABC transporter permease [SAR324 cluster bacterium]
MDFEIIFDNLGLYVEGMWLTLELVSLSLLAGFILAVPMAIMRVSKNYFIAAPVRLFVYIFRGTPLLVQIYIIYYGLGQFDAVKDSFAWPFFKEAYFCCLFAFALNTGAYTVEILRGAIAGTPFGEIEAAVSVGMSRILMLRRIILPSAFRRALPAYGNEVIFMLHGTSLASIITLVDLTGAARIVNSRYYSPYEAYLTAAVFYMGLTFTLVWLFKKLEFKWFAHLRPRKETV